MNICGSIMHFNCVICTCVHIFAQLKLGLTMHGQVTFILGVKYMETEVQDYPLSCYFLIIYTPQIVLVVRLACHSCS